MAKARRCQPRFTSVATQHVPRPLSRPRVRIDRSLAWYAIKSAYKAEAKAEIALRDAGFATYLPSEAVRIHRRGKLVEIERVPVSGYLFVGTSAIQPDFAGIEDKLGWTPADWYRPALGGLIRVHREPVRIGAGAIQDFADECTGGLRGLTSRSAFRPGDRARIIKGPWTGFSVDLERVACDHPIVALIDMMGRKARVEVHVDQLEAAA